MRSATTIDASIAAALDALAAGDSRRAESVSRGRLEQDPQSVEHLRLLGRALTLQSRFDEAEQTLRHALALRPESAPLHEDLGEIQAAQRRFEDAVASFQTAIRLDPRLSLARKKLG